MQTLKSGQSDSRALPRCQTGLEVATRLYASVIRVQKPRESSDGGGGGGAGEGDKRLE